MRAESHVIEEAVTGDWCDECQLPSALRWRIVVTPRWNPMVVWWAGNVWQCFGCERQWRRKDYADDRGHAPRAFDE